MANEENKKKEAEEQARENRTEQAKEDFDIPDEDLDRTTADDIKKTRAEWEATKIDLKNAKEGLKSLDEALHEAVKAGADKEVLDGIFEQWKGYNDKVTELEKKLIQMDREDGRPDPFRQFVDKSRENLEKGTKILGNGVSKVTEKFLHDKNGNPKSLTAAVLAEHNKVDAVYHEEQEKAAQKLSEDLDKTAVRDTARIDSWIDAIEASEKFENRAESKDAGIDAKAAKSVESVKSQAEILKASLHKKFEAKEAAINTGEYSRSQRMKGGFQTILDAAKGSPLKDYFGTPKTPEAIKAEVEKARKQMQRKESFIDKKTSLKIAFVKAWAGAQKGIEAFRAGVAKRRAQAAERNLEKIKSPRAKDILDEIRKATEAGKPFGEARNDIKKDISNANKDMSKKMDGGPGDR